jgi:hypothetical protein
MSRNERERATVIGGIILGALCLLLYSAIISRNWDFSTLRQSGNLPIARDFATFWAASKLALSGNAAQSYNINELFEIEMQFLGTTHHYQVGYYYPPIFLLLIMPFGLMSYLHAFLLWLGITFILYLIVFSRISNRIILPLCVLSPGVFLNFYIGQNGFLSGALIGGGLLLIDRTPFIAGFLFGLLSFKPTLALMSFIALASGRHWKALIGAFASVILFIIISVAVFGLAAWIGYLKTMSIPMRQLEIGLAPWSLMPTFFAAILSAGLSVKFAYMVQGTVMLLVLIGVAWGWRRNISLPLRGTILVLGTLLFTPYALVYELALLALPLCWLWEEGRIHGRWPGELFLLTVTWIFPLVMGMLWDKINIFNGKLQIGPFLLLTLFILALLKAKTAISANIPLIPANVNDIRKRV